MPIVISAPRTETRDGTSTISSVIRLPDAEFELYFRGPSDAIALPGADPFLIAVLSTAMRLGEPVVVEGSVSARLLAQLPEIQQIFACWRPKLTIIDVEADPRPAGASTGRGSAVFFSGGVDSFHSATRHLPHVSALVLVHGFDMALDRIELRTRVSRELRESAQGLGRRLIEVETNLRELSERHVSWLHEQFGAGLAAVAHLLGPLADRTLIPSSSTYDFLEPFGSHPLVDHLWSTETMSIVHDGAAFGRARKVADLASEPIAMRSLRVCWRNPEGAYNCGRCEKCLRTIANLVACGALDRCATFDPGSRERLRTLVIENDIELHFVNENIAALRRSNADPEVLGWLEGAIVRHRHEGLISRLRAHSMEDWTGVGRLVTAKLARRLLRAVRVRR